MPPVVAPVAPPFYLNVHSFGALGNSNGATGNGADDTAAIAAACVAAAGAGGVIFFPPGIYRCATAAITIAASNVHVLGSGMGATQLFFDSTDHTAFSRLVFSGGASSGTIKNVSCRDLTIFGPAGVQVSGAPNTPGAGWDGSASMLTFQGCQDFVVDGCETYNSPNYGISILRCTDGTVRDCLSHDNVADGIHVMSAGGRISVIGNHTYNTGDDGIGIGYTGSELDQVVVSGNTVYNAGSRGIAIFSPSRDLLVANNVVKTTWLSGIEIEAGNVSVGNNYMANCSVVGNIVDGAGLFSAAGFARGTGVAAGIQVHPQGGTIAGAKISDNIVSNSANGHIWLTQDSGGGTISDIVISDNVCSGIAATGGSGSAATGGGVSQPSPDGLYPGILIRGASLAHVTGNIIDGAYHDGLLADQANGVVRSSGNTFRGVVASGATGKYGQNISSGAAISLGNLLYASPNATSMESLGTILVDANNATYTGQTLLAADNFTRANASPTSGALGSTSTGAKSWSGSAAGIVSNTAYFNAGDSYPAVTVNCGASDVDISVTATMSGQHVRLVARDTNSPATSAGLIFSTNGECLYYDGSAGNQIGSLYTAISSGTHVLRLVVKGNNVTAYIDGSIVASGSYSMPTTNYVGFGDEGTAATSRFSAFSVSTAA